MKSNSVAKRIAAFAMTVVMAVGNLNLPAIEVHAEPEQPSGEKEITGLGTGTITNPEKDNGISVWDMVEFGSYPQKKGDIEWIKQPIKWRILSVNSAGNALLLADKALDCRKYNEEDADVTWETSTVRHWLNATEAYENDDTAFLKAAFSTDERNAILTSDVSNPDNPNHSTEGGNDTRDRIFLLSIQEVTNADYGFGTTFEIDSKTREAAVTDYAKSKGAFCAGGANYVGTCSGNGNWWLRSPAMHSNYASGIAESGWGFDLIFKVDQEDVAIRPALQINLNSSYISDAGKVFSDGNTVDPTAPGYVSDGYNDPTVDNEGITSWDCVYFGNYFQNEGSSFEVQPIEWRVLSVSDNDLFLLADKSLDCRTYNGSDVEITWENCELRAWLNDDFINTAFTDAERAAILTSHIENPDNPQYNTPGGNSTRDKVFLLSIQEASNEAYGFDCNFGNSSRSRIAQCTDYTIEKTGEPNGWYWWLRSPGAGADNAVSVWYNGMGMTSGVGVNHKCEVRPALHIDPQALISTYKLIDKTDGAGAKYKLTTAGDVIKLSLGSVEKDGENVNTTYSVTDNSDTAEATQLSLIVSDGTWTEKGWSEGASIKQYTKLKDLANISGTLSFSLDESINGEWGKDYHVFIVAEDVNSVSETDYASTPVEIKNIIAVPDAYEGAYDGKPHGVVCVTDPDSGAEIRYGKTEGTYDLEECPVVTDATDNPVTIYYQIKADGYFVKTGSVIISISKADPAVTVPLAREGLRYAYETHALITAGKVEGGEMLYALGVDDKIAPKEGWNKEVPAATDIGTYYVWYKVVGDKNHKDIEPACLKVKISDPTAEKQVKVSASVNEIINNLPVSANLSVSYPEAVEWTGKKVTKAQLEALLTNGETLAKLNVNGLEDALKDKMKEGTDVSKLFKYGITISRDKDVDATGYFTVKVKLNNSAVSKAKIKGDDKKALAQLVKDMNDKLKDTKFEYKIAPLKLAEAEKITIKAKLKDGALQQDEKGNLTGIKSVKVKIKIKGVKKAKTFTYNEKKSAKLFKISVTDATNKKADITALEGTSFIGTAKDITIKK